MIYSFRINTDLAINPNSIPYPAMRDGPHMTNHMIGSTCWGTWNFQVEVTFDSPSVRDRIGIYLIYSESMK